MPASSGASHGFAAFASVLIGAIMSKYVWQLVPPVGEISLLAIEIIQFFTGTNLPTNEQFAGTIVVMFGLSFVWGIVYHIRRHN